jgi:MATE family multidrug resistance protein
MHIFKKILSYFGRRHFIEPGGYIEIWNIAYPLVIMSASHSIMQFVDRKFLAMNSTEDVAAALPAGILYFTMFCFFMVTTNFTSALVAQFFGARDNNSCVRASWTGFYFAIMAAVLIVFAMPYIGLLFIQMGGHSPKMISLENEYFLSLVPSGAFVCISAAFFAFFSGRGKTAYVATVNTIACVLNIFLDYIFIFGKLGLPAMGIVGAGLATSLATMFSFVCILCLFLAVDQQQFETRKHRDFRWDYLKKLFGFGTPAGLQVLFDVGAFTLVTFMIGHVSKEALATTTIALSINLLSFMPLLGFSDATSIITGQFIGRNKHNIAAKCAYRAWRMAAVYMCFAGLVYLLLPRPLIGMFSPNQQNGIDFEEIMRSGSVILALAALFNFFDATKFIFMGALRGAGDTKAVMIISSLCAWGIMVPGTVTMIFVFKAGVAQIWMFLTFYILIESLIIFWRFRSGKWQKINMIDRNVPEMIEELPEELI